MGLERRDRVRWLCDYHNWQQEDGDAYTRRAVPSRSNSVCTVRLPDGSGVNREVHAPFCERPEVQFPDQSIFAKNRRLADFFRRPRASRLPNSCIIL